MRQIRFTRAAVGGASLLLGIISWLILALHGNLTALDSWRLAVFGSIALLVGSYFVVRRTKDRSLRYISVPQLLGIQAFAASGAIVCSIAIVQGLALAASSVGIRFGPLGLPFQQKTALFEELVIVAVGLGLVWYSARARKTALSSFRPSQHVLRDELKSAIQDHDLLGVSECLDLVHRIPERERLPALIYDLEGLRLLFDKVSATDASDNLDQAEKLFDMSERILQEWLDRVIPEGDKYDARFVIKTIRELAQSLLRYVGPSVAGAAFTARLTSAAAKTLSDVQVAALDTNAKNLGKTFA